MKSFPKIAFLIILLIGTVVACKTTNSKTEGPTVLHLIVYGKVDSISAQNINISDVLFIPYHSSCRGEGDSTIENSGAWIHDIGYTYIKNSGTYKDTLMLKIYNHAHGGDPAPRLPLPSCFKAFVALNDAVFSNPFSYVRLLAGPKKLGRDFIQHFRAKPPYDSVRIDFVVHDSVLSSE